MTQEEIKKHIKKAIILNYGEREDWDKTIVISAIPDDDLIRSISPLIKKEKDRILYESCAINYLRRQCFFDLHYNFNDTLNNLSNALLKLVNIMNE